jgi:pilus assembly protein Flp/PilA
MKNAIKNFVSNESGATAIEYGLIAVLISVAVIAGAKAIGLSLATTFSNIADELTD